MLVLVFCVGAAGTSPPTASSERRADSAGATPAGPTPADCLQPTPPLASLPLLPAQVLVLRALQPDHRDGATMQSVVAKLLRGRCLILLGDSTMAETAHDTAILLHGLTGASLETYLYNATRMPTAATYTDAHNNSVLRLVGGALGDGTLSISVEVNHRKMWFTASHSDTAVYARYS